MKPVIRSVELPNEVRLSYIEQGDPSGIPVLLLHGITDSCRSFEGLLAHLPPSLHAFALSHRGHGDSSRPAAGYRPQDFAADLAAFVDTLELGPAIIAGHSMSSIIAQRFAIDHSESILGLVLMGSFARFHSDPALLEFREAVAGLTDPIDPAFAREFQLSTLARPVPPGFLDMVVQESLKVPARVWQDALEGLIQADLTGERRRIQAPTLIAWGDQDAFCPRDHQDELLAGIARSELQVYPGAGHAFHWEEPPRFAADLATFAETVAGEGNGSRLFGGDSAVLLLR
jgi:pimeloyl-ACP methyl ester carboxylesterase